MPTFPSLEQAIIHLGTQPRNRKVLAPSDKGQRQQTPGAPAGLSRPGLPIAARRWNTRPGSACLDRVHIVTVDLPVSSQVSDLVAGRI
jgi:hypothetical protein